MAKKRSHPVTALVLKPKQVIEEPIEVIIQIPRTEFPERFKVTVSGTERFYSRSQMEEYYTEAVKLSKSSGLASCYTWMENLKIDYAAAVWIMDIMEARKKVKPIVYNEGVAVDSGPRKFIA